MTQTPFSIEIHRDATQAELRCPNCGQDYPIPNEQVKTVLEQATPEHGTTCQVCTKKFSVLPNFYAPTQLRIIG